MRLKKLATDLAIWTVIGTAIAVCYVLDALEKRSDPPPPRMPERKVSAWPTIRVGP